MKWLGVLSLVIGSLISVYAQETSVSQTNPASIKWSQINTPHFRIVFPVGFDVQAQRMANTLEAIREPEGKTIGAVPRKISVILQNQSAFSNGFVSPLPRRAEFYAMPSQDYRFVGNNDWLNLLATHEYRHMAQYQHAYRGFNKFFYYLFGGNSFAGLSYVAAPQWFWEGDAVATETAFTSSGRGRIPSFDLLFRTNLQEGRTFNYHKQYLESYKNQIPNWYVLGYHMVSYLRKHTNDPHIWDKVTARSWNVPFIPFRFSSALKAETGMTVNQLYRAMAQDLQRDWKKQQDTLQLTTFEKVNQSPRKGYTDYFYPQELEDGSIVVRKSGIGDIETLVSLKSGEEQKIFTQGPINESAMLSATNSRMVWNEYRFDPRWQVRNYSVIVGYDKGSGKRQVIGDKSRYASAALSPDGYQVATIETSLEYKTRLVILDYFSGKVIKEFENPTNDFISMPRWTSDGKEIVALTTNTTGKAITSFQVQTGAVKPLTPYTNENIGYPVPYDHYVLYNSPISGIDNIYALDLTSGKRYQVTSSRYGSYNPMVSRDGQWIYYNDQSRDGMDVVRAQLNPSAWKPWTQTEMPTANFGHLVEQEGHPAVLSNLPQQQYEVKRYRRWKGLINPYSWGGAATTSLTSAFVGVTSQDILSTTLLSAGYAYDRTERTGSWTASASYLGWYPIIDFSVSQSDRKVDEGNIVQETIVGNTQSFTTKDLTLRWSEKNMEAGLRLPLITTSSKYYGSLTLGNAVGVSQVSKFSNSITGDSRIIPAITKNDTVLNFYSYFNRVGNGNLVYNHITLSAYRLLKQSHRDINSKFGQALYMNIYNTPYAGDYSGRQFSIYGLLFLPGVAKHHSLWGYWGYQNVQIDPVYRSSDKKGVADNGNYYFRNQIPLPRGLSIARFVDFYSMSANYTLPVWYPDIAIGPLLNVQRVRVNGFFDYGFGRGVLNHPLTTQTYMSTGVEVKFDVNVMRLLPQLDLGFRYSKGLTPATSLFEILIGTINF